jgi:hypothetical protein
MTQRTRTSVLFVALASLLLTLPVFAAEVNVGCTSQNPLTPPDCAYTAAFHSGNGNVNLQNAIHNGFTSVALEPGGVFGGTIDKFDSTLQVTVVGSGELQGFKRTVSLSLACEAHSGPYDQGARIISFETDMMRIEGELEGDEDFASLRIVGGTANGFPSPGQLTAVDQGEGFYMVDSMFDMSFQVEYVGAAGGALDGFAGSFEGTATMRTSGEK